MDFQDDLREVDGGDLAIVIDRDLERAIDYLRLGKEKKNNTQIATLMGCSRGTLQRWIKDWRENGTLARADAILVQPKLDAIREAQEEALEAMPAMIRRLIQIASDTIIDDEGNKVHVSARSSIEAFLTLNTTVIEPFKNSLVKEDDKAAGYADRVGDDNTSTDPNAILGLIKREARPNIPQPTGKDQMPF